MSTGILVAIVTAASILGAAVITAILGPIISPWYSERLNKAQLRVSRRIAVRTMIESELSKGFLDLGAIGAYFWSLNMARDPDKIGLLRDAFGQMIISNETKYGLWLGYTIDDSDLRALCEGYRDLIRDIRIAASQPLPLPLPDNMESQLEDAKKDADQKATEIIGELNRLGW